jgi:hypothetical protein
MGRYLVLFLAWSLVKMTINIYYFNEDALIMDYFNFIKISNGRGYDFLKALHEKPIKAIKIEPLNKDLINELEKHATNIKTAIAEAERNEESLTNYDRGVLENAKKQLFKIESQIQRFERFKRWGV